MNLQIDINRLYTLLGQKTVEVDALTLHIENLEKELSVFKKDKSEFPKEVIKKELPNA